MTAEHAHGIDGGGEVEAVLASVQCPCDQGHVVLIDDGDGSVYACPVCALTATRQAAADAVLAEARQLCCGNNPSAHHAASAKHSERMAFAGDLARAVRGA